MNEEQLKELGAHMKEAIQLVCDSLANNELFSAGVVMGTLIRMASELEKEGKVE